MISAVITYEDQKVSIHSSKAKSVRKEFDSGFYSACTDNSGNMYITEENLTEIHSPYRTKGNDLIISTINAFFRDEVHQKVKQLGFTHKLGIMLFGKQGTGKTSMLHFIAEKIIKEKEGIVLFCNNSNSLYSSISLARMIREIQPNPIVLIADEFERFCKETEADMKNLLDGNVSIDNTLFLAATNYLDKIPDTLKNRPSRFRIVQEVSGITDKNLITEMMSDISNKLNPGLFTQQEIKERVMDIKSLTIDEIKHICLDKLTDNYIPKKSLRNEVGFKKQENEIGEEEAEKEFHHGIHFITHHVPKIKETGSSI